MKTRKLFTQFLSVAILFSFSLSAAAAPYSTSYSSTVTSSGDEFAFPEVNDGEAFTVTLVFDNGGATTASQVWDETDLTCLLWSVNNAGDVQLAFDLTSATFSTANGQIATDGGGALTQIFSSLTDDPVAPDGWLASGINIIDPVDWYLNDANDIVYEDNGGPNPRNFGDSNGGVVMEVASWSNPAPFNGECAVDPVPVAAPVPSTSFWALMALISVMLTAGMWFSRSRV